MRSGVLYTLFITSGAVNRKRGKNPCPFIVASFKAGLITSSCPAKSTVNLTPLVRVCSIAFLALGDNMRSKTPLLHISLRHEITKSILSAFILCPPKNCPQSAVTHVIFLRLFINILSKMPCSVPLLIYSVFSVGGGFSNKKVSSSLRFALALANCHSCLS